MRQDAVTALLERAGEDWSVVEGLIARGLLVETAYAGQRHYLRRLGVRHTVYPKPSEPSG
jgi:hypothetical protein